MASIERTAYPRFKPSLTAKELQALYEPTEEERDFVSRHARREAQQLTLLTLLKCQQHLGSLHALADVPDDIRTHLCQQLQLLARLLPFLRWETVAFHGEIMSNALPSSQRHP